MNASAGRHRMPRPYRGPLGPAHTALLLAAFLTGGSGALAFSTTSQATPNQVASPNVVEVVPVTSAGTDASPSSPVRIDIPAIAVNAAVEPLHRGAGGTLSTPNDWDDAGWYADGVVPGDRGPTVIVGHLDSARDGPAVFYRLPALRPGDAVLIETGDGHRRRFVVDASHEFPKSDFPTQFVYGPTAMAELRLITCTGAFDRRSGNYLDNLIVTAHAA